MKKNIIVIVLSFTILLSGCISPSAKPGNFPELPIIEGMELETTKDNDFLGKPEPISTYVAEDYEIDSFLNKYSIALENDGWNIVERRQANVIVVKKGDNQATIIAYKSNGKLKVDVKRNIK